jgi:lysophospholipase L1-like esterase
MKTGTGIALAGLLALLFGSLPRPGAAQALLNCGPFTQEAPTPPRPRENGHAKTRFEEINAAVKNQPHRVLFLGDSLTEHFDQGVWQDHMAPRGVLNAGVSGDRTDHLRWRLEHGNLDGPPAQAVVLLIGTNDLGYERSPEATAEGIRANLLKLRQRLPRADILLLGLWPREDVPRILQRREIATVNRLIGTCGGGRIRYEDLGGLLLEPDGRLSQQISPDRLHFSAQGYARLAPSLDRLIDPLLAPR